MKPAVIPDSPVDLYALGFVSASVCAPEDMPVDEVTDWVNRHAGPTGLDHGWAPSTDPTFSNGMSNPCPCEQTPGRVHRLYNC
jgi:hypothetical protein